MGKDNDTIGDDMIDNDMDKDRHNASDENQQERSHGNQEARDKIPVAAERIVEHGGPKGLEPTRYGDWEKSGRCTDF